jgi:hypothetical protein
MTSTDYEGTKTKKRESEKQEERNWTRTQKEIRKEGIDPQPGTWMGISPQICCLCCE